MALKNEVILEYSAAGTHVMVYKRHREFHRRVGPAILWYDGALRWYHYGTKYNSRAARVVIHANI